MPAARERFHDRISHAEANQYLSRDPISVVVELEVAGEMVPSLDWFIYAFVRKEAVLSSQIEGTQATLTDLLEYEAAADDRPPVEDVREISILPPARILGELLAHAQER